VREVIGLDEIDVVAARDLPANQKFTVYASNSTNKIALMDLTTHDKGVVDEALAFTKLFDNSYPSDLGPRRPAALTRRFTAEPYVQGVLQHALSKASHLHQSIRERRMGTWKSRVCGLRHYRGDSGWMNR
jgi:hypothetical protein